jgi:hypothetical protein
LINWGKLKRNLSTTTATTTKKPQMSDRCPHALLLFFIPLILNLLNLMPTLPINQVVVMLFERIKKLHSITIEMVYLAVRGNIKQAEGGRGNF